MGIVNMMNMAKPPADLIERIGYASDDEFFRKPKFWRSLIDYRKYGLKSRLIITTNARKELYYIGIRMKKMIR